MRASSGRHLLQSWLSMNTLKCHIAIETKNTRVKLYSSKSITVLDNIIKRVKPFGKVVVIDLPYDVQIKPTCPHEYPDMDTVLVKLITQENSFKGQMKDNLVCVNVMDEACEIRVTDEREIVENIKCLIQIPVRYDVDVKTLGDGNVEVHNIISDFIAVQTEFGNIMGSGFQGKKITLSSSEGGSVTIEKSIQGEIEINTAKDGFVDAEKCLGTKLDISTENGSIKIGSNYCEKGTFTTLDGNLNLNNLHMDNIIDIHGKGNLSISCLDGSLEANIGEGSAKIQLARVTKDSVITSNGDIKLIIPEKINTKLILKSPILKIDQRLEGICYKDKKELVGRQEEEKIDVTTTCTVESTKKVEIEQSNWMETFKLQNTPK